MDNNLMCTIYCTRRKMHQGRKILDESENIDARYDTRSSCSLLYIYMFRILYVQNI